MDVDVHDRCDEARKVNKPREQVEEEASHLPSSVIRVDFLLVHILLFNLMGQEKADDLQPSP
eukprot:CAMPEP_0195043568 /NCGR_PEP_ID=MMETSP0347-20130606/4828_1 /TAXON_ID=2932 /ORGANISM="Alexandrium fundyense, Strain CCMP1719" /LENGTH=61 /DNA_ID=CAMNT_0040071005 /DNA_START=36 /DNA_END=218 /DNA_ORIENTATION=+